MAINRGSEWHRWDLHIHTPETKLNNEFKFREELVSTDEDGEMKDKTQPIWENYCTVLNSSGVKCFGITDYFSVDNYLYLKENRVELGLSKDIILFPNIELRVTGLVPKGRKNRPHGHVNVHVIFSNNPDVVSDADLKRFLRNLQVKNEKGAEINYKDDFNEILKNNLFSYLPDYSKIEKSLEKTFGSNFKDKSLILIPNGDDGLSPITGTNYEANNNFMKNTVDIIQSANSNDRDFYLSEQCENALGRTYPCISGSDAHDFDRIIEYPKQDFTWIKAEPSFEGLKSILYEPEYRVRIQETIPSQKLKSKIISHIKLPEKNFGREIVHFNDDLNVIIGGRSSGKSLLLSLLGKKAYGIENVKGSDVQYDQMVSNLINSTELFNKSNEIIESNMIIEYFHQDKLQEIARDREKLNGFVEETLGTSIIVSEMYRKNGEKKAFLKDQIQRMLDRKEELTTLKKESVNLQDEDTIKKNIRDLEESIGEISIVLSDEDNKKIECEKVKIEEYEDNIKSKEKKLEKIKELSDENIAVINEPLLKDSYEILGMELKDFRSEIDKINEKYKVQLLNLKENLIKEKNKLNEKSKKIKNKELMIRHFNHVKNTPELKKLTEHLYKEKKNLKKRLDYNTEENNINKEIAELSESICNKFKWSEFVSEEEILSKDNLKISHKISVNYQVLADVFSKNLKIGYRIYKDIAVDSFEEIISFEENTNSKLDSDDFNTTLKNILLMDNNEVFRSESSISDFLFELSELAYIVSDYDVLYESSNFNKMSEGKKALVLLLIKLEIGEEDCPILIDQPEDDLDNRSIMDDVIDYFKKEKLKRQVFIVTHNANIVIACDSENIIIANEHDSKNPNPNNIKYYYKNGSLEEVNIKSKVCKILEGGEDAFKARENRYVFSDRY